MASALNLNEFFVRMEEWGVVDVLLPFLLIFSIIFAVLQKTRIMGEEKKNINVMLALIISLITVIPHVTGSYERLVGFDVINIINAALPSVSLIVVAIIMMLILIGLFAHERLMFGVTMPGWIAFFSFAFIVIIFGSAAEWWNPGFNQWLSDLFGQDAIAVVVMLLVFGIIIAFVTGESEAHKTQGAFNRMGFDMSKLFGGGKGH